MYTEYATYINDTWLLVCIEVEIQLVCAAVKNKPTHSSSVPLSQMKWMHCRNKRMEIRLQTATDGRRFNVDVYAFKPPLREF